MGKHGSKKRLAVALCFWAMVAVALVAATPRSYSRPETMMSVLKETHPGENIADFKKRVPAQMFSRGTKTRRLSDDDIRMCETGDGRLFLDNAVGRPAKFLELSAESNSCRRVAGYLFGDSVFYRVIALFTEDDRFCGCATRVSYSAPWRLSDGIGFDQWQPLWLKKRNDNR